MYSRNFMKFWLLLVLLVYAYFMFELFKKLSNKSSTVDVESDGMKAFYEESDPYLIELSKTSDLQSLVNELNQKQEILNENLFGPFEADDTIIAIQVHNKIDFLKLTIESLEKVKGIEKTLIIFSHSLFDVNINKIVRSIKFAKVMQIFYPYSTQIFPNSFPGNDPNDCPRDVTKEEAMRMKCNNAEFPDKFGHYRESRFVQIRHHWFWKINFIFENLHVTRSFNGHVVFIDENYYLLPDSLYFLNEMKKLTHNDPNCVYSLGTWKSEINPLKSHIAVVYGGIPHNSYIITKHFWLTFKIHSETFCNTDDFNFDAAFVGICQRHLKPRPHSMYPLVPRVYYIGDNATHVDGSHEKFYVYEKTVELAASLEPFLFPKRLEKKYNIINVRSYMELGGFNDPRDKSLCMTMCNV
ncbi:alpha-1:6-mannosyl-glycoprotein 2-beta-N-acetylglucosaminyltransferase-like isoform X2 [Leptotrombidium deliense]|uniref:Alpha-1,6-mannosyl-glycoprotein 2-beta-N-acetylglucosaminyltransferase n=1 Tax=Leptotrombidium deliense TaxID=299467 RepID=A0A443S1Z7_9ACAR|nr:alpha-1:6-mannosyl-glycoprotein 2-beta-N-acetylglucosaminyltransferase-like isoform X2 [Leptotrombidium deliense]